MKAIPQIDWAKLASFIDGEGYIQIRRNIRTQDHGKPTHAIYYQLIVSVTNTEKVLTDWLKATFGGRVFVDRNRPGGRRICYVWICSGALASEILWNCLPHFIIKENQAKTAIVFNWTYPERRKYKTTPKPLAEAREVLYRHLRKLKIPKPDADLLGKVEVSNVIQ